MNQNIHIFDTPDATARAVAELILIRAKAKSKQSQPFNLAVSGGSTPTLLFTILANEYADSMPWHIVRLFWVDERCVPPTHPESNFGMTYNSLLRVVPIHDENIFRMLGEADPQKESVRYEELLREQLTVVDGVPLFDMILLGMGDDGHTASIFPDNLALLNAKEAVAEAVHPTTGQHRITLTGPVLMHATDLLFMVTGISKAGVIRQIVNQEDGYLNYPSAHVYLPDGKAAFYLDAAAAKELK